MEMGYGFPSCCWDPSTNKSKFMSVSLHLNERQFRELIWSRCPKLNNSAYYTYKQTQQRKFEVFNARTPQEIKDQAYSGTLLVYSGVSGHHPDVEFQVDDTQPQPDQIEAITESNSISSETATGPVYPPFQPISLVPTRNIFTATQPTIAAAATVEESTIPIQYENSEVLPLDRFLRGNGFTDTQQVLVSREDIFERALDLYKDDSLLNCKLYVSFEGEEGDDFDGLTRDFFCTFWSNFIERYCSGQNLKYIKLSQDNIPSQNVCKASGRILLHGFLLLGYIPISMCPALVYKLLTNREPSDDMLVTSFLQTFTETEERFLTDALRNPELFNIDTKSKLVGILNSFSLNFVPSSSVHLREVLTKVSKYSLLIAPFFMTSYMYCEDDMTKRINEGVFSNYYRSLLPTGDEVCKKLHARYSDIAELQVLEERVFSFVERYVQSLDRTQSQMFMRYVSGSNIIQERISVSFNGISNTEEMLPKAHACGIDMEVSRFLCSFEQLKMYMDNIFSCSSAREGFHAS